MKRPRDPRALGQTLLQNRGGRDDVLRMFREHQKLVAMIRTMSEEIERLQQDNARLRAAVKFYRDAARDSKRQQ
ncbi:MAG TPA: hypothetical protein VKU19_15865 [Bryobacteraceae bacterium]|nr:hypothetical protein [Bryobacteraceae bacterium]